jgi:hypothetical protein
MSDAALAAQVSELVDLWRTREVEMKAWLAGTPTGGPNDDGRYPLTAADGTSYLVACPAKLADLVEGPAASAAAAALAASADLASALAALGEAEVAADLAGTRVATVTALRDQTMGYRDQAATHAAAALTSAGNAASWAPMVSRRATTISQSTVAFQSTGLTLTLEPGVYVFDIHVVGQCNGAAGSKYQLLLPSGATIEAVVRSTDGANLRINSGTLSPVFNQPTSTARPTTINGMVNVPTAGSLTLRYASVTSGQFTTILANSFVTARRVA